MTSEEKQYTWESLKKETKEHNKPLMVLFNGVYDVTKFMKAHPGGDQVLKDGIGKDCTEDFVQAGHLNKAYTLRMMTQLRVGVMK